MKKEENITQKIDEWISDEVRAHSINIDADLIENKLNQAHPIIEKNHLTVFTTIIIMVICVSLGFISVDKKVTASKAQQETIYFNDITLENMEKSMLNP